VGCHCGGVRFELSVPSTIQVYGCNFSICANSGYLHLLVAANDFTPVSGGDLLSRYTFNTATAQHLLCKTCGIKSFYVPRSDPQCYSVNVRCLDPGNHGEVLVEAFDGANWEAAIDTLR